MKGTWMEKRRYACCRREWHQQPRRCPGARPVRPVRMTPCPVAIVAVMVSSRHAWRGDAFRRVQGTRPRHMLVANVYAEKIEKVRERNEARPEFNIGRAGKVRRGHHVTYASVLRVHREGAAR